MKISNNRQLTPVEWIEVRRFYDRVAKVMLKMMREKEKKPISKWTPDEALGPVVQYHIPDS